MEYEERRLRVSCKKLCGSLVDMHQVLHGQSGPDDVVTIVHGSAREYLIQKHWINSSLEHAKAATFCFRYLTSEPFRAPTENISQHARQGYYGFQDYAVQHCLHHMQSCTGLEAHEDVLQHTMESARGFLATYSLPAVPDLAALSHHDIFDFLNQLPKDKRERADAFTLGYQTLHIRTVIERIRLQDLPTADKALIRNVYGTQSNYKCPKLWCDYFWAGFEKLEDREKHVNSHDRPFPCPEEGCFAFQLGYSSKAQLDQHELKHHSTFGDEVQFPKATKPKDSDTLADAAARNDLVAMLAFLESGASANGTPGDNKKVRSPMYRAASSGHVEACQLLLESGASDVYMSIHQAIKRHHTDVVHCLLSWPKAESMDFHLAKWIEEACYCAHVDIVHLLLESSHFRSRGIEDWKQYAPGWITTACSSSVTHPDNITMVKYLLEKGFTDSVSLHHVSIAKFKGGDYLAGLLQSIVDLHTPSNMRAEKKVMPPAHAQGHGSTRIRSIGPPAEIQQRLAMQTEQEVQMLTTKLYKENVAQRLNSHNLTQETCPPEFLQKFRLQCVKVATDQATQLAQQRQRLQQLQQQALAKQQEQTAMQQEDVMPQSM